MVSATLLLVLMLFDDIYERTMIATVQPLR